MIQNIPYFFKKSVSGKIYSIDMITLQGYGNAPDFETFCYNHHLEVDKGDTKRKNKYMNIFKYLNFENVGIDYGEFIGADTSPLRYNDDTESWDTHKGVVNAPFWKCRFNPNKCCKEVWFSDFLKLITEWSDNNNQMLYLNKVDLAVDMPGIPTDLIVKSRKSSGRVDSTFYFGKSGRSGYCKIYDKGKEIGDKPKEHLRVEYTFVAPFNIHFDEMVYLTLPLSLRSQSDIIIRQHILLSQYDIYDDLIEKLDTREFQALKKATNCQLVTLDFEPFDELVQKYCSLLHCSISCQENDEFEDISIDALGSLAVP